ncbi:MAG: hypothetical protein JNN01_01460 [Opitutaceae bacterium]|nr:hypothetical protein [Opitutaceae bacterium]
MSFLSQLSLLALLVIGAGVTTSSAAPRVVVEIDSLTELARYAALNDHDIRLKPGVYSMADYVTEAELERIRQSVDRTQRRPTVRMMEFSGSGNVFDLRDVILEIPTTLYPRLPGGGYVRCLFVSGDRNTFQGLTIRNVGPNQGSNGNLFALFGREITLEQVTLHVHGSFPYGYGDLLGKGGPNLVSLQKQSGIQVMGDAATLRRCKVYSRAFGHCFYIQGGNDIRIEDCYAEGIMRSTNEMLRETDGPAFKLQFKSVYENRDGRFLITPGYMKSLVEDGFRTYAGAGNVTLINCMAVNTRAGFEIGAPDTVAKKTVIESCLALGCERGYLLGSNVIVRHSRGDTVNGPLLYLRGGRDSDIELELTGRGSEATVHATATLAGLHHRVKLTRWDPDRSAPQVPLLLGFGMPEHAEMASPIRPAETDGLRLINETGLPLLISAKALNTEVTTNGPVVSNESTSVRIGPSHVP